MTVEKLNAESGCGAALVLGAGLSEYAEAHGFYTVECRDADGNLKWSDVIDNLVTTGGKNDALDKYLAGSAYTATWFLGLVDGGSAPTYAAGDTMASHAGWTEITPYSNATRVAPSFAAASAGSKATSAAAAFNINATATVAGLFLCSVSTKGGSTGILYSCGSFSAGNRDVLSGDTLNATYTASL